MAETIEGADLFCGAGGSSEGLVEAGLELGREVDLVAVNHSPIAVATHSKNHPKARHYCQDIRTVSPRRAVPSGRLDILLAGAPCPHFSAARGSKPMDDRERSLPREIHRWHEELDVASMLIECVSELRGWGPLHKSGVRKNKPVLERRGEYYKEFIARIRRSGYTVEDNILNAADYGDATTRTRLFIMARKKGAIRWPGATHTKSQWRPARDIIDWSLKGTSIFNRKKPLADATIARIMEGLRRHGMSEFMLGQQSGGAPRSVDAPVPTIAARGAISLIQPLILKYYSTGIAKPVSETLDTITTLDRFGLVEPTKTRNGFDVLFRMLQPHELWRAMGFPDDYQFTGNRREVIRQVGNAWACRTGKALCLAALAA